MPKKIPDFSNSKINLILYGGNMAGVYSAGVVTEILESGLVPKIANIYTSSAGAFSGAYLLAENTRLGTSIYIENLDEDKYVKWKNIKKYFWHVLLGKTTKHKISTVTIVDIDVVMKQVEFYKRPDTEKIYNSPTNFYIELFSITKNIPKLFKVDQSEQNLFPLLRATASGQPGFPLVTKIKSEEYVDGNTFRNFDLMHEVSHLHPDDLNICVFNHNQERKFFEKAGNYFEFILNWRLYGFPVAKKVLKSMSQDIKVKAMQKQFPSLFFIINPVSGQGMQTNRKKLITLFEHGILDARKLFKKLNIKKPV